MAKDKINTAFLSNLVSSYQSKLNDGKTLADIITFVESSWGLGIPLLGMQKFLLKVFYGLPLESGEKYIPIYDDTQSKLLTTLDEVETMDFMINERRTNLTKYEPGSMRRTLVLVGGRRASKSTLTSIICNYELYRLCMLGDPQGYYGLRRGQEIDISAIATSEDDATTIFNMMKTEAIGCPFLKERMAQDTQEKFSFLTDTDRKYGFPPSLRVQCGSPKSGIIRSKNNLIVVMDEAAFLPSSGVGNGWEVYRAFTPSTSTFVPEGGEGEGKIILISSPYDKSGLFWDKYCESLKNTDTMLMFKFYSTLLNPKQDSKYLMSEKKADPQTFSREFGGEFSDSIRAWVDDPEALDACVKTTRETNQPRGVRGISYFMGIDYGGKKDGTAICICHKENDSIVLDYADVYYSKTSDVWKIKDGIYQDSNREFGECDVIYPGQLADVIVRLCNQFDVVQGWFDQNNGLGLLELLKDRGLHQFEMKPFSNSLNLAMYQTALSLINVGKLSLFNHPVLVRELKTLEERRVGSSSTVAAPQRAGYHDDISDAFVISVYTAYNSKKGSTQISTLGFGGNRGFRTGSAEYRKFQFDRFKKHGGELYENFKRGL